ncbi:MAG: DUF1446 domain-containing protein [Nitriliruptor sp.]|nr:MAG: DUF1446 domain-containing protein [Nitriliruptor sp.]
MVGAGPDEVLRIGNVSGFYGDRATAMREMVEAGPIDVITGDYLAELTMLILWRSRQKDPSAGYAKSFLRAFREVAETLAERDIKVVVNAGGLAPAALADAVRETLTELAVDRQVAHVEGDDLHPRLDELDAAGEGVAHLDTDAPLTALGRPALTANAYLGGWGIATALDAGADIVVTGRVTDASLVVGPAAWRFGWQRTDWDRLAGAVVAGHIIECGAQATGGNYSFFRELPDPTRPGFPIAEVRPDGSSVITKHDGTGGAVSLGTVTAQLLYEIGGPRYLNPDVTARFDTIRLHDDGPDRVRVDGIIGEPPPRTSKVSVTTLGGFRNRATFVLTGLDIDAKAALVQRQLAAEIDLDRLDLVDWQLVRSDHQDAPTNAAATASLTVTVHHHDPEPIGRHGFADACVGLALASYPGFTLTAPPADAEPFGRYWPGKVSASVLDEQVVLDDGSRRTIEQTAARIEAPPEAHAPGPPPATDDPVPPPVAPGDRSRSEVRAPLGLLAGARSGDKGGDANIGVWVRDPDHLDWLLATLGSPHAVRALLPEAEALGIEIHPLPNLSAVNLVIRGLLGDGVASATRPDPQAKGLGEYLRSRWVAMPAAWRDAATSG